MDFATSGVRILDGSIRVRLDNGSLVTLGSLASGGADLSNYFTKNEVNMMLVFKQDLLLSHPSIGLEL